MTEWRFREHVTGRIEDGYADLEAILRVKATGNDHSESPSRSNIGAETVEMTERAHMIRVLLAIVDDLVAYRPEPPAITLRGPGYADKPPHQPAR
jgi:hypothetical protein